MVEIILKNNIEKSKIDALLQFLKSHDIDAELKNKPLSVAKKKSKFSLSVGIWEDYQMDGGKLRKQAWKR